MNALETKLLMSVHKKIIPKIYEDMSMNQLDINYFRLIGVAKKVFENAEYDLYLSFFEELLKTSIQKTQINFEDISAGLENGKNFGEFLVLLAKKGRSYLEELD